MKMPAHFCTCPQQSLLSAQSICEHCLRPHVQQDPLPPVREHYDEAYFEAYERFLESNAQEAA